MNFPVSKMATKSIQTDGVFSCTVMFCYYTIDMHCIMIYTVYFFDLIRSLFYIKVSPFGKKFEATQKKLEFATGNSDHLTIINGYKVI